MTFDVKAKLKEVKAFVKKLDKKVKILSAVIAVLILVGAIATALILNHKEYVPLFSEVSEEEATEIVSKLQEDGVDYQYKGGGTILVESSEADSVRASLVYEGYPQSGFTYDIFTENAGGMTTDTEKQTYKLYELQNRIGATIALFDGVKDAKVTIALAGEQKYVLEDDSESGGGSASVVVTMRSGAELDEKQAKAIQRLVAKSVPNMEMENVAVFDENGVELSSDTDSDSSGTTESELANIVEQKISDKVANILAPFYGAGNVRVSANGKINMEKIIRESTTYTTPDKIDANDKTGIVSQEQTTESSSTGGNTASGTAGTESNADITEYNQEDGTGTESYESNSYDREYLVNSVKEQTEIDPGVMDDLTVSVSVNGKSFGSLSDLEVKQLVANATGISFDEMNQKITVVAAPFYTPEEVSPTVAQATDMIGKYWQILVGVVCIFILIAILLLIMRRRKKKKDIEENGIFEELPQQFVKNEEKAVDGIDILNMQNEKSRELREHLRDFAETNPEISAQMLRSWLNGGEQDGRS